MPGLCKRSQIIIEQIHTFLGFVFTGTLDQVAKTETACVVDACLSHYFSLLSVFSVAKSHQHPICPEILPLLSICTLSVRFFRNTASILNKGSFKKKN